jgi:hypothetical protein
LLDVELVYERLTLGGNESLAIGYVAVPYTDAGPRAAAESHVGLLGYSDGYPTGESESEPTGAAAVYPIVE